MLYDRNLHTQNAEMEFVNLAFQLNAQAIRLALLVRYYEKLGEDTIPVQYLRRCYFTRREWELATKGTRKYDGRRLADPDELGKDGCESLGIIKEIRLYDSDTKKSKTVWVIGDVDAEKLERLRKERLQDFEVIEDPKTDIVDEKASVEKKRSTKASNEVGYDEGYLDGERHGYAQGYENGVMEGREAVLLSLEGVRCVNDAPLDISSKEAANTQVYELAGDDNPNVRNFYEVFANAEI